MTLETLSSNDLPTFLIYDTINATRALDHQNDPHYPSSSLPTILLDNVDLEEGLALARETATMAGQTSGPSRRKRTRRTRTCKNTEDAESQRMTHIAVERNRRRQMNEYLSMLRSLMPESYIQRGDQASIVGGAIDFVKELEQHLQSLEAQKRTLVRKRKQNATSPNPTIGEESPPFAQFFSYPQYIWCHAPRDCQMLAEQTNAIADIEVNLIETHANLRILSPHRSSQLLKIVAGLQSLRLTILHLNVTSLNEMVLYSLSVKLEEGCNLTTVEDIAAAVHHLLAIIEAESSSMPLP